MVLVEADDLVDDLDAGVAATLGFPAPGRENQSLGQGELGRGHSESSPDFLGIPAAFGDEVYNVEHIGERHENNMLQVQWGMREVV